MKAQSKRMLVACVSAAKRCFARCKRGTYKNETMNYQIIGRNKDNATEYYWIAINGGSCAMSITPMRLFPTVSPVPNNMIGFRTIEEARDNQHFLLTAPIEEANDRMQQLLQKARRDEIVLVIPEFSEPPVNRGEPTLWLAPRPAKTKSGDDELSVDTKCSKALQNITDAVNEYINLHNGNCSVLMSVSAFDQNFGIIDAGMLFFGPRHLLDITIESLPGELDRAGYFESRADAAEAENGQVWLN
jgi:hypothetical protein